MYLDHAKGIFLAHAEPDAHHNQMMCGLTISEPVLVHGVIIFQDVELNPSLNSVKFVISVPVFLKVPFNKSPLVPCNPVPLVQHHLQTC